MLINYDSPWENHLYLDLASDNAGNVSEGQESEPVESTPEEDTPQEEPFYTYTGDDGQSQAFKDQKELNEYIRSGTLRHSDYTRKTQSLAEQRKAFEAERAKYDAEYTTFLNNKQEYDKIENYLKSLPPDVYNKLKQGISNQPRQEQYKDPRLDELLKERDNEKKQREEEAMRQAAFESLSRTYEDFDKDSVMNSVNKLQELAPGDSMRGFLELIYLAEKGRMSPAQIEQKMAENLKKKSSVSTPMGSTVGTPSKGSSGFKTIQEAYAAAKNDYNE